MECNAQTLKGTLPAIVTPFTADGSQIDYASLESLINFQIGKGVTGIVVCGSTGEAATLSDSEYKEVIQRARQYIAGRVFCIAGIGSNNTVRAVEMAKTLESIKVDGILLVAPPYNKPPQSGIFAHFAEVKKATTLPIVAYNVPGRSAVNILPATIAKLAEQKIIVGLKESSGSVEQMMDIVALTGDSISILSGEDALVHALMACGAKGCISVSANVLPDEFSKMTNAALKGDWSTSLKIQVKNLSFVRAMFMETNPIPVKTALGLRGLIANSALRLPLVPAEAATVAKIKELMALSA